MAALLLVRAPAAAAAATAAASASEAIPGLYFPPPRSWLPPCLAGTRSFLGLHQPPAELSLSSPLAANRVAVDPRGTRPIPGSHTPSKHYPKNQHRPPSYHLRSLSTKSRPLRVSHSLAHSLAGGVNQPVPTIPSLPRSVGGESSVSRPALGGSVTARAAAMAPEDAKRVPASLPCPEGYRPNVGICLVNRDNRVFVASRIDKPGAWQMPQGGIDAGESPCEAAQRELREETGVTSAELLAEVPDWLCYDFPPDVKAKLAVAWGKEWQGQAQKWFLFRFTAEDEAEITLLGDGSERPEFDAWQWMDVPSVIQLAVEFKRPVYEAAFQVFQPFLKG